MGRVKDKRGLTHQQELFCQFVVDAYGTNTRGVLVSAYRKAYNCKNDAQATTHYANASRLMSNSKIIARVEELREERARLATISRERIISDDVKRLDIDPLDLWIIDEKTHQWRMRFLHEIPKETRKLLTICYSGKRMVPDIDKNAALKRLIDVLGFSSAKDLNITATHNIGDELRIGFGDDPDD